MVRVTIHCSAGHGQCATALSDISEILRIHFQFNHNGSLYYNWFVLLKTSYKNYLSLRNTFELKLSDMFVTFFKHDSEIELVMYN